MLASLDLGLKLVDFLQLLLLKSLALLLGILGPEIINALLLLDLEDLELLAIVHGFLDSLVDCHQLFVLLHVLELVGRLDLQGLDSSVQLLVQKLHLFLVLAAEVLHFDVAFFSEDVELAVPVTDELLQLFITNLDVLFELSFLDINTELVLVDVNVSLKETNLSHQVLVQLVLLHIAQLLGKNIHLLLDQAKHQDLLVFVQLAITTLIEDVEELLRRGKSE